ncbi:hypothetical protein ILUMI_01908, partial [Ignelater luminosus]
MENASDTRNSRNLNHQLQENLENNTLQKYKRNNDLRELYCNQPILKVSSPNAEQSLQVQFNEQESYNSTKRPEPVCVLELESDYDIPSLDCPVHDSCVINDDLAISNTFLPINQQHNCKKGTVSSPTDFTKFISEKQINEIFKVHYSKDQLPLEDLDVSKEETSSSSLQKRCYTLHSTYSSQKLFYYFPSYPPQTDVSPDVVYHDSPEQHSHSAPSKDDNNSNLNEPMASSTRTCNSQSSIRDIPKNNLRQKSEDSADYYYNYVLAYRNTKTSASTISYLEQNLRKSGLKVVLVSGK